MMTSIEKNMNKFKLIENNKLNIIMYFNLNLIPYKCICGKVIKSSGINDHIETKKHQSKMAALFEESENNNDYCNKVKELIENNKAENKKLFNDRIEQWLKDVSDKVRSDEFINIFVADLEKAIVRDSRIIKGATIFVWDECKE